MTMSMEREPKKFLVSDGNLTLWFEDAEEGGFVITSPFDAGLVTESDTLADGFAMARDALEALAASRLKPITARATSKKKKRLAAAVG